MLFPVHRWLPIEWLLYRQNVRKKNQRSGENWSQNLNRWFSFFHMYRKVDYMKQSKFTNVLLKNSTSLCVFFHYMYISLSLSTLTPTHAHKHTHTLHHDHTHVPILYKNKFYDSSIYQRLIWHCAVFFGTGKLSLNCWFLKISLEN